MSTEAALPRLGRDGAQVAVLLEEGLDAAHGPDACAEGLGGLAHLALAPVPPEHGKGARREDYVGSEPPATPSRALLGQGVDPGRLGGILGQLPPALGQESGEGVDARGHPRGPGGRAAEVQQHQPVLRLRRVWDVGEAERGRRSNKRGAGRLDTRGGFSIQINERSCSLPPSP